MTQLTLNFKKDLEPTGETMTSSSLVGSRESLVNHSHLQEKEKGQKMNAISGQRCLEQYEKFNHVGLLAKTFPGLLIGMEGWFSNRCKLTWKLRGTKSYRLYFQLQVSTLRTGETEFGLWLLKTPTKFDGEVTSGMLPTPVASDSDGGITNPNLITIKNGRFVRTSKNTGTEFGAKLRDVAQLLPTPCAIDWKGMQASEYKAMRGEESKYKMQSILGFANKMIGDASRQLNPQFVMEMMGFPKNYTELPFQNGEKNLSKPVETQSSHKSVL